jgi:dihydropyrimidinase
MGIVLKGGTVVNADSVERQDLRINGPVIDRLGFGLEADGDEVIDVAGCYLFPGGIDPHTHFDLEVGSTITADDFATGSKAALIGGTTTVIDYATQSRGGSLTEALSAWHGKARGKCFTDYGFHLALCDCREEILHELETLPQTHGVTSIKLYMAYKDVMQVDDASLLRVMRVCHEQGLRVCLHCENGDIIDELVREAKSAGRITPEQHAATRPEIVEAEAVFRGICLAEITGCPLYIVHVSTTGALSLIRDAQRRGLPVTAETCPQYLLLDESCYEKINFEAAKYVLSPPLRSSRNQAGLWQGLADGSFSCVGSDHCSFNWHGQKELGRTDFSLIPNGAPGVENRFGLLYTFGVDSGRLSLQEFVKVTSANAARLFGLYPRKGMLGAGSDADIVIWDPTRRSVISAATQTQKVDYNAYEGLVQDGVARHVFLRGQPVVKDGVLHAVPLGEYLPRNPVSIREGI